MRQALQEPKTDSIPIPQTEKPAVERSGKFAALLSVIFFFSGFSALLYQIVWQRLLSVHYGVGATSVTVIVTVYMLGLGVGALVGGRLSKLAVDQVKLYVAIEALTAVCGLLSLPVLNQLGMQTHAAPAVVCLLSMFLFLCIPTGLMGMSLPVLSGILCNRDQTFLKVLSSLYCLNTLGACLGACVGAYVLISIFGLDSTVYIAASINLVMAISLAVGSFGSPFRRSQSEHEQEENFGESTESFDKTAYFLVGVSGFIAIAMEMVWFRTVEILVKASPYAFATVLTVYLLGIGIGSWLMSKALLKVTGKKRLFFILQGCIGLYTLLSYKAFCILSNGQLNELTTLSFQTELHPSFVWPMAPYTVAQWFTFFDFVLWPAFFLLVPTILMGASFPLIAYLSRSSQHAGEAVGNVYFFNILGNVAGGLVTGFVLLDVFGSSTTILLLSLVGICFFIPVILSIKKLSLKVALGCLCGVLVASLLWHFPGNKKLITSMHHPVFTGWKPYVQEGMDSIVVTYESSDHQILNYINGLGHGGRYINCDPFYAFYRRGVDGLACAKNNDHVLVIGYGTGAIVEAILKSPDVKKVTIVELNKSLMTNLKKLKTFQDLLNDPRLELVIDDGRRYLNRTSDKYDAIFMDPLRSSTASSNNLYSQEFFDLAARHMQPGGTLMVWLDNKTSVPATIVSKLPFARMYGTFVVASNQSLNLNAQRKQKMLSGFPHDVQEGIERSDSYVGDSTYIAKTAAGKPLLTDMKPACEYYLGEVWQKLFDSWRGH